MWFCVTTTEPRADAQTHRHAGLVRDGGATGGFTRLPDGDQNGSKRDNWKPVRHSAARSDPGTGSAPNPYRPDSVSGESRINAVR